MSFFALPISGGSADAGDPGVGLVETASGACTGVLIAPDAVITAGHCADALPITITFDDGTYTATAITRHPQYASPSPLSNDLAVLTLDHASSVMPSPFVIGVASGQVVQLVGDGADGSDGSGARRTVTTSISAIDGPTFTITGPANACAGDSGAPAFVHGLSPTIAGIISSGQPACGGTSTSVRTSAYLPWLASIVPAALQSNGQPLPTADQPPTVMIARPGDGATMPDELALGVTPMDDYGALSIAIAVDGTLLKTVDMSATPTTSIPVAIPPGDHVLTITAADDLAQTGSTQLSLTIEPPVHAPGTQGAACWDDTDCTNTLCDDHVCGGGLSDSGGGCDAGHAGTIYVALALLALARRQRASFV
jgi:uncharacterized protein (TIGR03382 family)